jgi:hypothetical protein
MNLTEWFSRDPVGAGIVIGIIVILVLIVLARFVNYLWFDE